MSSGLATVCSDIGGNNDLIFDDVTGYRVPVKDVNAYVEKVSKLFDNIDLREKMGKCSSKYVEEHCSYDVVSKRNGNNGYQSTKRTNRYAFRKTGH